MLPYQPRFSLLKTADLRGLNLGAMGSRPDLLVTLFDNCRHLTTLNLWKTYVEVSGHESNCLRSVVKCAHIGQISSP